MRVGIDARFYHHSGIGRYLRNLISNLQKLDKENKYFIFLPSEDYKDFKETENFKKVKADIKWYSIKEQFKLVSLLNSYKLDLVHFPHFNIPIFYRGKFIVTLHDLIHHKMSMQSTSRPSLIYALKHLAYQYAFKKAVNKSEKILTVSNFVKKDLLNMYKVDESKIIVTYEGVEKDFLETAKKVSSKKEGEILKKFNIKPPFLFYIGNAHPHKNVSGLVRAFELLRKDYQYLTLVLAGDDPFFYEKIKQTNPKDVVFTGKITDEELITCYKNAQVYIQPSFEEGFGLPVLEAMSLGCPVVSSNTASLPEVAGDGAVFFNPSDIFNIYEKIKEVLNNEKLRKQLREKGLKRVKEFDFQKMTKQTLSVYNSI